VEGLKVVTPVLDAYVLPLAIVILIALFSVQWRGTAKVAVLFGPITACWFLVLAAAGVVQIAANPAVLWALNPAYGVMFLLEHHTIGLVTLAAVFLVITGSEALYNDLGHFGRKPIQAAWQIYMPRVNWLLLAGVLLLAVMFRSSGALASAYVLAVAATEAVTAVLGFMVIWKCWHWSFRNTALLMFPFIALDALFVAATSLNFVEGAWLPVMIAFALTLLMLTWVRGTVVLNAASRKNEADLGWLVRKLDAKPPHRISGTAVFLTGTPDSAPWALLHNLKHNNILHERNIILSMKAADAPYVANRNRLDIEVVSGTFTKVSATYGFMETPSVPKVLALCRRRGLNINPDATSFFLSRRVLRPASRAPMPRWQEKLFIWLAGSAEDASEHFQIPDDRVVEIGAQVAF
jgi:KUP system potassium uptake protein